MALRRQKNNIFEVTTSSLPPGRLSKAIDTVSEPKVKVTRPVSTSLPEAQPQQHIKVIDKRSLCVDTLAAGYVQSFVDFFYLTHRPDPKPDPYGLKGEQEIDVPVADMIVIKDGLIEAESARRTTDKVDVVYRNYNKLAEHYQTAGDHKTGIYFYEKCLEIARMTEDSPGEMEANHNLGLAYEAQSNFEKATGCHERHLKIADKEKDDEQRLMARQELKRTYFAYAEQLEANAEIATAADYFTKCMEVSKAVKDSVKEGSASYRLGKAQVALGGEDNSRSGMEHLERYLVICKETDNIEGQGAAHAALAAAQQSLGDTEGALEHLKQFLNMAKQTGNLAAQSKACHSIGAIYNGERRFNQAVSYFQQNYELSRKMAVEKVGTPKQVDTARVNLGMAKGNQQFGKFMHVINADMRSLLHWKNARQDIS